MKPLSESETEIEALIEVEAEIVERQQKIHDFDDTYMQAPDPWPDPPNDEESSDSGRDLFGR